MSTAFKTHFYLQDLYLDIIHAAENRFIVDSRVATVHNGPSMYSVYFHSATIEPSYHLN